MAIDAVTVNRAPVLTLWAAIVAERLGFTHDEALTLGRAVAGLNAYSKGKALGIFKPTPKEVRAKREAKAKQVLQVELLHRAVEQVLVVPGKNGLFLADLWHANQGEASFTSELNTGSCSGSIRKLPRSKKSKHCLRCID
jgi:hypothetical protein